MFEKEAKEFEKKARKWTEDVFPNDKFKQNVITRALVEFAKFGYNKANEWHDLRKNPNDLPKEEAEYLVIFESDGTRYKGIESYYPDTKEWSTIWNILIWKEIIPPKEIK